MRVTNHAVERAKERFGWKPHTTDRMARRVFRRGVKPSETKSKLYKYIEELQKKYPHANNIRLYGDDIFFFNNRVLITCYRLPQELIKYTKV